MMNASRIALLTLLVHAIVPGPSLQLSGPQDSAVKPPDGQSRTMLSDGSISSRS